MNQWSFSNILHGSIDCLWRKMQKKDIRAPINQSFCLNNPCFPWQEQTFCKNISISTTKNNTYLHYDVIYMSYMNSLTCVQILQMKWRVKLCKDVDQNCCRDSTLECECYVCTCRKRIISSPLEIVSSTASLTSHLTWHGVHRHSDQELAGLAQSNDSATCIRNKG